MTLEHYLRALFRPNMILGLFGHSNLYSAHFKLLECLTH